MKNPNKYTYIGGLTRGGLTHPADTWLEQMYDMEKDFCVNFPAQKPLPGTHGIVKTFTEVLQAKYPQSLPADLRRFVMTRINIRRRCDRQKLFDLQRTLRAKQKAAQFSGRTRKSNGDESAPPAKRAKVVKNTGAEKEPQGKQPCVKPHKCQLCPKAYKLPTGLQKHMQVCIKTHIICLQELATL